MAAAEPSPSVIVSHVDIVYRVFAGSRPRSGWRRSGPRRGVQNIHAVKDVSFVAKHGESIGVIGRNGSGKSTLLRTVAGLVPPSAGDVWADGTPALLGVNTVLVPQLSGARNVYLGAQALGLSKAEVDEVYDEVVEFSGIGDAIHLPMSTYSSGMAARLRFAISTAAVPPVLVIDEALATGDAAFRARSKERIEKLREQAGTVFLVSHSAATIRAMCDRALWLDQGELVMDGPVDEVVDAYADSAEKTLGTRKERETEVPGVQRWSGSSKYDASAVISRWGTPGRRDTVVLAEGRHLTLAFSAIPAATVVGAPVVLTAPKRLVAATQAEVSRLEAERVVLLGGPSMISDEVAAGLEEAGAAVERVAGEDPVSVSLALHSDVDAGDAIDTVFLVPSDDPEAAIVAALSARGASARVLLVDPSGPTPAHSETLERIHPRRLVLVADAEVVGDEMLEQLSVHAAEGAERLLFPTPVQAVSHSVERFGPEQVGVVYVASAARMSQGSLVTGISVACLAGAPVVLVDPDEIPPSAHVQLERLEPSHIVVIGTRTPVSTEVRRALAGYLSPRDPELETSTDL